MVAKAQGERQQKSAGMQYFLLWSLLINLRVEQIFILPFYLKQILSHLWSLWCSNNASITSTGCKTFQHSLLQ